jgi:hypothetical protein
VAQEHPNRLAEWFGVLRKNVPLVREHVTDWVQAVREEPRLIWETSGVRYSVYGLSGLLLVWVVSTVVGWMVPPLPPSARPAATTADFHVVCAEPTCAHHFLIHREFGFDDFPVPCPQCKRETGVAARRCNSPPCGGRWVAPKAEGLVCPFCGATLQ